MSELRKITDMSEISDSFNAYYYSFKSTGCRNIDNILKAIAFAGSCFHNTEDWNNDLSDGYSPVELIQHFANIASNKDSYDR